MITRATARFGTHNTQYTIHMFWNAQYTIKYRIHNTRPVLELVHILPPKDTAAPVSCAAGHSPAAGSRCRNALLRPALREVG